jgi:PAS domain S-box-containing protein
MDRPADRSLISVKRSLLSHPVALAVAAASAFALVAFNVAAFVLGLQAPWLLGAVLLADMLVVGVGIFAAARAVLRAEETTERARDALEESEARLAGIVDSAMDAIITVDEEQRIVLFNRTAEQLLRCRREEAIGASLDRFIPERFRTAHRGHVERFGRTGVTSRRMGESPALWALRAGGEEFPMEASISQVAVGGRRYFTVILRDLTLRKRAEEESARMRGQLDAAQARIAAILDSAMDAIITVDEEQRIVLFNRAAEQMFRVRRDEALGAPLDRFLPARFREAHREHIERFGRTGVTARRMGDVGSLRALRADGEEFPIEASISQVSEGGRGYFTVILRDVTIRVRAQEEVKRQQEELRALSAQVLEAREEEKTLIARELHDELGQLLTALKMDVSWLRERLREAPHEAGGKVQAMNALIDNMVASVRRISADLRPLMLDDLGLADAAAWLVEDFAQRSGVNCDLRKPPDGSLEGIERATANTVYRALQESLTNIARHAGARNAWVVLAVQNDWILAEIEDDGRGIAPENLAGRRSLGLKGMRERVHYLGGMLEITRAPRGGTRVRLRVPLRRAEARPNP